MNDCGAILSLTMGLTKEEIKRLGATLKQLRQLKGLSQTEVGNLIGKSQNSISDLERGQTSRPQDVEAILNLVTMWRDELRRDEASGFHEGAGFWSDSGEDAEGMVETELPTFMADAPEIEARLLRAVREAHKLGDEELEKRAHQILTWIEECREAWRGLIPKYRLLLENLDRAKRGLPSREMKRENNRETMRDSMRKREEQEPGM